jgi:3-phosphoshikimate 1-carboxyvinyltransferase
MIVTPARKPFACTLRVPGDKSVSHRAVMLGAIAHGDTEIEGFLPGADCLATIRCFREMGVEIEQYSSTSLKVKGKGLEGLKEPHHPLNVGNSGTTIRLMLGILASAPFFATVVGDESIARRPMGRVTEPLRRMGATIDGREQGKFTPLAVRGGSLRGICHESPVASAQVKSCLLLAGLHAEGITTVREPHLTRDHTERMLAAFGVEVERGEMEVRIRGGQRLTGTRIRIPGDISSAAFVLAAALMVPGSRVTVEEVGINPTRTGILDAFRMMGAEVTVEQTGVWGGEPVGRVTVKSGELKGIEIGGEWIPRLIDEIPVLAVVATQVNGTTVIRDAAELKVKETDRIAAVAGELRKLGAEVLETEDGLVIHGPVQLRGGTVDSRGDHRIGMAMAVAGLAAGSDVRIDGSEMFDVSFPGFAFTFRRLTDVGV